MCEGKSPTVSLIHPMRQRWLQSLVNARGHSAFQTSKNCDKGWYSVEIYIKKGNVTKMLEVCCASDPRFKSSPYHNDDEKSHVYDLVIQTTIVSEKQVIFKVKIHNIILIQTFCSSETDSFETDLTVYKY